MDNSAGPYGDISPADRDAIIRTVIGEAGSDPASQAGVAAVIANRMRNSGQSAIDTVLAKSQFEPWSSRPRELLAYSPDDPIYKNVGAVVDGITSGSVPDPTHGATMFYSPSAQAALGRTPPSWDDGTGVDIGKHRFFGGTQTAAAAPTNFLTDFALAPPNGAPSATTANQGATPMATPAVTGVSFATPEQMAALKAGSPNPTPSAPPSFLTDFELSKPGATANPSLTAPAPTAPVSPPIGINDAVRATATGVPVVGGALNKADAALNATLAPYLNRFFSPNDQLQGDTWDDRYQNALKTQTSMDAQFAAEHPTASNALNIGGSVLGTAAGMRTVPAAFGITGQGLAPSMILGGLGGGALGAADTAVRSEGDLNAIKWGAGTGAVFGAAGVPISRLAGYGVNALSNAISRTTPAAHNVATIMSDIGMTPQDAQAALRRIGPQATLADVDPAFTTEAGGVAAQGGAPTSVLKSAMATRAAGADNRVAAAIDQALGAKPDLEASLDAMLEHGRQTAAPYYDAARANPTPMDVSPLVGDIDRRIATTTGGVSDALRTARSYLVRDVPGFGTTVKNDPQQLLSARQALDDLIERRGGADTTAGRNALREVQNVRSNLDAVLKEDPNIAAGDAAFSNQMQLRDAMQQGTQLFTKGVRPEEFTRQLATMSPAEVQAYRAGARVAIGDALEQARRGELSGAQSMFARASANRAKLDALFPNAGDVFDMLHGEAAMRSTEQRVAMNSATAERQAVQAKYAPKTGSALEAAPAVVGNALAGGPGALGLTTLKAGWNALSNTVSQSARDRLLTGMARGMSATGDAQNAFLDQVARASRAGRATNALANSASFAANLLTRTGGNALQQYLPSYSP